MAWNKAYPEAGIPWDNDNSPYLNETNMGIIDEALKTHDERIIELYGIRQTVADYAHDAESAKNLAEAADNSAWEAFFGAHKHSSDALVAANNAKAEVENAKAEVVNATAEADRAKSEADRASAIVGIDIATTEKAGIVKASDSVTVDPDGTMHSQTAPTVLSRIGNIEKNVGNGKIKNLLPSSLKTQTSNGVTITRNADGTYTLNGTATSATTFYVGYVRLEVGTYRITGSPTQASGWATALAFIRNSSTDSDVGIEYLKRGLTVELTTSGLIEYRIYVGNGFTCNNLVFKPMICKVTTATYDDYIPYSGTADTLVGDVANIPRLVTDEWQNKGYEKGRLVISNNTLYKCIMAHASGIAPTNTTYWRATTVGEEFTTIDDFQTYLHDKSNVINLNGAITPTQTGTRYQYQNDRLKGATLVKVHFQQLGDYDALIMIPKGMTYDFHKMAFISPTNSNYSFEISLDFDTVAGHVGVTVQSIGSGYGIAKCAPNYIAFI